MDKNPNETMADDPMYREMKKVMKQSPEMFAEAGARIHTAVLVNLFIHLGLKPIDFYKFSMRTKETEEFIMESALLAATELQDRKNKRNATPHN